MKLKLVEQKEEVAGVYSFIFEPPKPTSWLPGQYMHYLFEHPNQDDRGIERWFTNSAAPYEQNIRITTRFDGERQSSFKQALLKLNPGDEIESDGPSGKFVLLPGDVHHILIAGGIGITPFRSMLAEYDHQNIKLHATLLYANRDENFVFNDELEAIASKGSGFEIKKFVDKRLSLDDFKPYLDQPDSVFYVSGPEPMVENYYSQLVEQVGEDRVKKDFFPGY